MSAVIDSSVAVVLFSRDPRFAKARDLFGREDDLHAPALLIVETANALWKLGRARARGDGTMDDVRAYVAVELPDRITLHDDHALIADAFDLASELDHPVYDCLFVALALRRGEPLYTFDARLAARLRAGRLAEVVKAL